MTRIEEQCGSKHFKLASWIVGIFIAGWVSVLVGVTTYQANAMEKMDYRIRTLNVQTDIRIRQTEQFQAATEAKLNYIAKTMEQLAASIKENGDRDRTNMDQITRTIEHLTATIKENDRSRDRNPH
jgi:hypothetical protein